jgi:SAM-dependent methyltransferase
VRSFLSQPRVFDLASACLQYRDRRGLSGIGAARTGVSEDPHFSQVFDYNAGVTSRKVVTTSRRAEVFYHILLLPPRDVSRDRLLIIGPRNVQELFIAYLHGFSWGNIEGVDLYSTNPRIRVMNMEAMEHPDQSFDAVAMSNTFGYSKDPLRCLSEVARVLKPGGRFAFGANYIAKPGQWPTNNLRPEEVRGMLESLGLRVYHEHWYQKVNALGDDQLITNFGAVKEAASA